MINFSKLRCVAQNEICIFSSENKYLEKNFFSPIFLLESGYATSGFDRSGRMKFSFRGSNLVLRRYTRTGIFGHFFGSFFALKELDQARSFREYNILESLVRMRLPVPRAVAARIVTHGSVPIYRADLITDFLRDARSLAEILSVEQPNQDLLFQIGRTIGTLHGAGVFNPNLGAETIMVDKDGQIQITDFETATFPSNGRWCKGQLNDLQSSLKGNRSVSHSWTWNKHYWEPINDGYRLSFA
jgi:3-deoxy-D-manno-octulosonic acid kinase